MKCLHIDVLKMYLTKFEHKLDHKPNGQSMYTFYDGLVLNVYETGSIVFQGTAAHGDLAKQIQALIEQINVQIPA
ncbi:MULTISPECIES: hypothetical protein [Photobacterium]|uniref:hypothetical protein n=1 Tax=Photobacterium TaxID=657 RepID=UPI001E6351DE|nr:MULTISPECIES: hypothetical protein [Photobacterium]MCD9474423.1 hypothetical protein [Photobacterium phosphoreum]MCD9536767.1 hypothetical protein [Photobacterium carnosum]MCF2161599.1 hypothetical protein [Photobacterium carnosum]MCF2174830.1 hypothetical protein [Photobacterium phosphoreum]